MQGSSNSLEDLNVSLWIVPMKCTICECWVSIISVLSAFITFPKTMFFSPEMVIVKATYCLVYVCIIWSAPPFPGTNCHCLAPPHFLIVIEILISLWNKCSYSFAKPTGMICTSDLKVDTIFITNDFIPWTLLRPFHLLPLFNFWYLQSKFWPRVSVFFMQKDYCILQISVVHHSIPSSF